MVNPSDNNSSNNNQEQRPAKSSRRSPYQWFQRGLEELKAGNAQKALTIFERLGERVPRYKLKAQMGRIQAYQKLGQLNAAQKLCQGLLTHPSTDAQQWAQRTLQTIKHELRQSSTNSHEGGHYQEPTVNTRGSTVTKGAETPREIPGVLSSGTPTEDLSGFTPLTSAGTSKPVENTAVSSTEQADPDLGHKFESGLSEVGHTPGASPLLPPPETTSGASLFHYQKLNQGIVNAPSASLLPPLADSVTGRPASASAQPAKKISKQQIPTHRTFRPAKSRPYGLWLVQLVTAITIIWLAIGLTHGILRSFNGLLQSIRWPFRLSGIDAFAGNYTGLIICLAILLIIGSPWLLDQGLSWRYQQHNLSTRQLQTHSTNAVRLLRQACRQRGWQVPELRVISEQAPVCFSYGWLPRNARIVVSQGLLEQLTEDEIAALYGYELAHLVNWDLPIISALAVWLFALHTLYEQCARWGDRVARNPLQRAILGIISALFYGSFWLFRKLGLWLSRRRSEWCDRTAPNLYGPSNQYQQLLLKLTEQITDSVSTQGKPHPLLVCLDVLMPVSSQQAISPGSFFNSVGLEGLIAWDYQNPFRHWLMANSSHPLLGERLGFLTEPGQTVKSLHPIPNMEHLDCQHTDATTLPLASKVTFSSLLLQQSPFLGLLIGGGIAMVLWFIGGTMQALAWNRVSWFYQDSSILAGGLLLGLGLGTLLRVNALYPDIASSERKHPSSLVPLEPLLKGPIRLPVEGHPVILKGTLAGAAGLTNQLCQSLYLNCAPGLINLQVLSPMGTVKYWQNPRQHPAQWIEQAVTVTGWARRGGGVLWVEVAEIRRERQPIFRSHAPVWTTGFSLIACLLGIGIIFLGG
jgi:Zn-dependent protease with chaperone function